MPRVPSLTPKQIIRILKKHEFILDYTSGSHYVFYHPETKRRVTVAHHTKTLPKGTLSAILRQAQISIEEL